MTVKDFSANLAASLMDRGISKEDAVSHVLTLAKTLTEDDLREITEYKSPEDFAELTESLADIIKKKNLAKERSVLRQEKGAGSTFAEAGGADADESLTKTRTVNTSSPSGDVTGEMPGVTRTFDVSKLSPLSEGAMGDTRNTELPVKTAAEEPQEIILGDDSAIKEKTVMTPRGNAIFWCAAVLTSPLTLASAAVLAVLFVLSVCAICAFIALTFALVLAEVAAGGAGFFVGLIYGAVKIFGGYTGTGLYEMGIGVACIGLTMVLSFFTYGFAAKTLPYLLKEVLAFWGVVLRRIGHLTERFREECNRL